MSDYLYPQLTARREKYLNELKSCTACTIDDCIQVSRPHCYVVLSPIPTVEIGAQVLAKKGKITSYPSTAIYPSMSPTRAQYCRVAVIAENVCVTFAWFRERVVSGVVCKMGVKCPSFPSLRTYLIETPLTSRVGYALLNTLIRYSRIEFMYQRLGR